MQIIDGLPKLENQILSVKQSLLVYPYRTALADVLDLNDRMLTLLDAFEIVPEDEREIVELELASVRRQWLEMRTKHNLQVEAPR